ncbi:MAG TPA: hypothetical protein VFF06_32020 [Polyangia bacterium]|nr:hypothetical protein [Polyangia bacterium]
MRARIALLALALHGCSGDLPPVGVVDKLRLLAVRAEPPEPAPGETVALDALIVEPLVQPADGGGGANPAAPSAVWLACPSVADASGTLTPCPPSSPPLAQTGASHATYVPAAAGDFTITLTVTDGAQTIVALKRLPVRDPAAANGAPPNHNPSLAAFTLADASGDAGFPLDGDDSLTDGGANYAPSPPKSRTRFQLTAVAADGAAEMEPALDAAGAPGGLQYESLSVAWFTTAGTIDASRTFFAPPGCDTQAACPQLPPAPDAHATWSAPTVEEQAASAPGAGEQRGTIAFWAVLRDDRGGVDWLAGYARP